MPHRSGAEFAGALYHVTARAEGRGPIFDGDDDRARLLELLAAALRRFDAACYGYCLMGNHYHVVVQTWRPNLARLLAALHERYHAGARDRGPDAATFPDRGVESLLIERNGYLLEACRYVDLNPVDAGLVDRPHDWPWSSYRAHAALDPSPPWLNSAALHRLLGSRTPWRDGASRYAAYCDGNGAGRGQELADRGQGMPGSPPCDGGRIAHPDRR